jgi:hypothetical protein
VRRAGAAMSGMRRSVHVMANPAAGIPKQAPPWFASQDQYEAFQKLFAMDLGAECITATSIDVEHLDEGRRKDLLSRYALRPSLEFVCSTYATLDAEALYSREAAFEKRFVADLAGDLAGKAKQPMGKGSRLMPPPALNQLIREVIEWCADPDSGGEGLGLLGKADFVHLVLSINGDQEAEARPNFFTSWPPSDEQLAAYNAAMATDDEMVLQELRRQLPYEFARMQTAATTVPHLVLGDSYDTWLKGWPESAPHDLTGDTPEQAFRNATKTPLREVIRMGLLLWDSTKAGDVAVSASSLGSPIDPSALKLLKSSAVLPLKHYRKRLAKERAHGSLAHRRYTFTERPLIEIATGEYIVLRPAWVLDRFCGSQLYWQTFFEFGTEKTLPGEQFSQAMNYVFEDAVGYLFRRATRRAGAITLITEAQMQQAWSKGGDTPSVCDWVLVHGNRCLLVDATNHWLDEKSAQGFADPEDYQADLEDTFVNKKFEQLKSTMKLLAKHGWEGCTFDQNTVYVPLVVVPNAGIPATVFADIDVKLQSGQFSPNVRSPGILIYHELQVFEGVCEHRRPTEFVNLLEEWRRVCTGPMPMRPQTFLHLKRLDRPMGRYVHIAKRLLLDKLGPPVPASVSNL